MDIKTVEEQIKKEFEVAICLMGILPLIVFLYILAAELASFNILAGRIGLIMAITIILFILGLITGRRIIWSLIKRLFHLNQQILNLQKALIEKKRLAAITETTLALSHEINNPLVVVRGNLDMLDDEFKKSDISEGAKEKIKKIKGHCERIRQITEKMSKLSKPITTTVHEDVKMIDAGESE